MLKARYTTLALQLTEESYWLICWSESQSTLTSVAVDRAFAACVFALSMFSIFLRRGSLPSKSSKRRLILSQKI